MKLTVEEAMRKLDQKGIREAMIDHRITHFPILLLALKQCCSDHQKLCECFQCTALKNADVVQVHVTD